MNKVAIVKSMVNGTVGLTVPELNLRHEWTRKGMQRNVDFEKLQQAMYDQGVENLFTEGILYIDNLEQKIELGLEPADATEPVNIKVMDDKMKQRMLTVMPLRDFKEALGQYSREQINDLVEYAIENQLVDFEKDEVLHELTQVDIVNAIKLRRSIEEN